jgi:hypothetical protein
MKNGMRRCRFFRFAARASTGKGSLTCTIVLMAAFPARESILPFHIGQVSKALLLVIKPEVKRLRINVPEKILQCYFFCKNNSISDTKAIYLYLCPEINSIQ